MAFQENRLAGDGIDARIDDGERRRRAEDIMPVMHHAVRMARGLGKEGLLRDLLLVQALVAFIGHAHCGGDARYGEQSRHAQEGGERHFRAQPQAPFGCGNGKHARHAAARPAKAAWTASVSMRPPSGLSKVPTSSPFLRRPIRSATWHAP